LKRVKVWESKKEAMSQSNENTGKLKGLPVFSFGIKCTTKLRQYLF